MLYQLSYARVANHLSPDPLGPISHVRGQTPDVSVADNGAARAESVVRGLFDMLIVGNAHGRTACGRAS
jgi:hypothetical protein